MGTLFPGMGFATRFLFAAGFAFACGHSGSPARAGEEPVAALTPILRSIEADTLLSRLYRTCPADTYRKEATLFSLLGTEDGMDIETCSADLKFCFDKCISGKSGGACFSLARTLQDHGAPAMDQHYEPLFALACAIGKSSGCTNRAAGMRNGGYEKDPSGDWEAAAAEFCQRRTFKIACDGSDAWGCAMYGQSLYFAEGGPADLNGAKQAFSNSCAIREESEACEFAKEYMEQIRLGGSPD